MIGQESLGSAGRFEYWLCAEPDVTVSARGGRGRAQLLRQVLFCVDDDSGPAAFRTLFHLRTNDCAADRLRRNAVQLLRACISRTPETKLPRFAVSQSEDRRRHGSYHTIVSVGFAGTRRSRRSRRRAPHCWHSTNEKASACSVSGIAWGSRHDICRLLWTLATVSLVFWRLQNNAF